MTRDATPPAADRVPLHSPCDAFVRLERPRKGSDRRPPAPAANRTACLPAPPLHTLEAGGLSRDTARCSPARSSTAPPNRSACLPLDAQVPRGRARAAHRAAAGSPGPPHGARPEPRWPSSCPPLRCVLRAARPGRLVCRATVTASTPIVQASGPRSALGQGAARYSERAGAGGLLEAAVHVGAAAGARFRRSMMSSRAIGSSAPLERVARLCELVSRRLREMRPSRAHTVRYLHVDV